MAETSNIARMAAKVSDEIFSVLGWSRVGPMDQNWPCVDADAHGQKKTHPSDVVLFYDDPYRPERVYWNVDLKSYASKTITNTKLREAVVSLAKAVECASVSTGWQDLYAEEEGRWRCDGLLFVYNHDGEFDLDFPTMLAEIDAAHFKLAPRHRMAVFGPPDVSYLVNVVNDIHVLRGKKELPLEPEKLLFWYPDLVRPKQRSQTRSAATIEMLTAPWMTLQVQAEHNDGRTKFVVYYRERGETPDEFRYLLDSFLRFQMLSVDREATIDVRLVSPGKNALSMFGKAKAALSSTLHGFAEARLENVRCSTIPNVVRAFSEEELGMEVR